MQNPPGTADQAEAADPGASIGNYKVLRREPLEHLGGTYYQLIHEPTGARHIHIACSEDNQTFGVLLPTVPQDSTGVAHILEHVVLAGSRRFPVRDPFFSMLPRSLKTFMNALTSSDWTMYPFSTRNERDFFNLLSIYLDAVFFPLISKEAFAQEGHRLEFEEIDDPTSALLFKGVVFNEMKGAMASPQSVMHRAMGKALFPGLTYAHNSGGEPEDIPDLTWEGLKEFHSVHYHPSNAYFFTYGNLPMAQILGKIDELALSEFSASQVDVAIGDVTRFTEENLLELSYPLHKEEDSSRKSQALVCWVTNHVFDTFETLTLKVLQEVLLGNAASPLRLALMTSGLGEALADGSGYHADFREAVFGAGLKGIDEKDAGAVKSLVLETLARLAEEGLDQSQVDAAIHQLEFDAREVSNQGYPFSLKVFFELSGAYMYGGDPYSALQFDQDLARLQEARGRAPYLEDAIKHWLLNNSHRAQLVLVPDHELEERKARAEAERLAKIAGGLSQQDKAQIVEQALRLKADQEAKQDLSSLPTLELSDVPLSFETIPYVMERAGRSEIGIFPQPTNGITYADIRADFSSLPEALSDLLPVFSFLSTKVGAGAEDYVAFANRISSYTGGVGAGAGIRQVAGGANLRHNWILSGKALVRNEEKFFEIIRDLLTNLSFEPGRVAELIAELRAQKESSIVQSGSVYAQLMASASVNSSSVLDERLGGPHQLNLVKRLAAFEGSKLDELIDQFKEISSRLRSGGLEVCITAEPQRAAPSLERLKQMLLDLTPPDGTSPAPGGAPEPVFKHQARTTTTPVSFNAKVYKTVTATHPDAPALAVLGHFMRATYLHREIREKGGAYGSGSSFDSEKGLFAFSSYRDPNIAATFQAFRGAVEQVAGSNLDPEEVKEAILSACAAVDPLESPDTKGRRRFFDDRSGYTLELRESYKRGLLGVQDSDLKRVAETYLSGDSAAMATVSNAEAVARANQEMDGIFEVAAI